MLDEDLKEIRKVVNEFAALVVQAKAEGNAAPVWVDEQLLKVDAELQKLEQRTIG